VVVVGRGSNSSNNSGTVGGKADFQRLFPPLSIWIEVVVRVEVVVVAVTYW